MESPKPSRDLKRKSARLRKRKVTALPLTGDVRHPPLLIGETPMRMSKEENGGRRKETSQSQGD